MITDSGKCAGSSIMLSLSEEVGYLIHCCTLYRISFYSSFHIQSSCTKIHAYEVPYVWIKMYTGNFKYLTIISAKETDPSCEHIIILN